MLLYPVLRHLHVCLLALLLLPCLIAAQTREWTDTQGRSFEGLLLGDDGQNVRIERSSDKQVFKLPRKSLSDSDNAYLDQLKQKERVDQLLKDIPKTYDEANELSVDKDVPVYIFYRNSGSPSEFDGLVAKLVVDPGFQEYIKDKAKVAVVRDKDVNFEAIAAGFINNSDRPCMLIIKGFRSYSIRTFSDTTPEQFRELAKEMYTAYDQSIY